MMSTMKQIDHPSAADGPVGSEGGRSPSTLSTGQTLPAAAATPTAVAAPSVGPLAPGQRWSVARKREVVLRLLRGESVEMLSRELGLPIFKLEQWRQKADAALDGALKEREADTASTELAAAMQRIGELSMENELLRSKQDGAARPFGPAEVALMAKATSPAGGQPYGIRRVCQAWGVPRSSFYAAQAPAPESALPAAPPARRGPKPAITDEALLAAIKRDLETSPWTGEGHRKVWARLRVRDGIRVSRKRLLRLMREGALLSPHRARRKDVESHERQIITTAPNVMWAIDATQVTTVQHGKVWIFGVAEHWNAEFLGWHVTKSGTRFEATQALAMAVRQQFGRLSAGAARGLALRHDHGSNFMAEHFQQQARFWGISPSYAFVGEPETNGVIERFFRTMKEQVIHGRVFQTIDEVRNAVRNFAVRYNAEWLIEKNSYRSPLDARAARLDTTFRRAA